MRYARDFTARRKVGEGAMAMNRLYVAESSPTSTGTMADHRLRIRPTAIPRLVQALAARLKVAGVAPLPGSTERAKWSRRRRRPRRPPGPRPRRPLAMHCRLRSTLVAAIHERLDAADGP
ncbi:MAG: hypothetical protein R2862_06810 [Thermoanaerobaculia bacterium]